jgi:hypothetical protein
MAFAISVLDLKALLQFVPRGNEQREKRRQHKKNNDREDPVDPQPTHRKRGNSKGKSDYLRKFSTVPKTIKLSSYKNF